jgi:hypothetical protein
MEEPKGEAVKRQLEKTENNGTIIIPLARDERSRRGFMCVKLVQDQLQWRSMLPVA